jgi:spore germination protein GerM
MSTEPAATQPAATQPAATQPAATQPVAAQPAAATPKPSTPATGTAPSPSPASSPRPTRTRAARLWFAKVDEDGVIELAPVARTLPVGDSPLSDNLAALLAGPTSAERTAGLVSFVPSGTVVRSVTVKGDTAVIDFNEQFRFNALGVEGLRAELRQVVWAATEFPSVSRVQVLIEGRRVDFLGPEGAAVGSPLGRDSTFQ